MPGDEDSGYSWSRMFWIGWFSRAVCGDYIGVVDSFGFCHEFVEYELGFRLLRLFIVLLERGFAV